MANCEKCNAELSADAGFCPDCGSVVADHSSPEQTATSAVETLSGVETVFDSGDGVVPQAPMLEEGDEFHQRYQVIRQIGAGAMGIIYLADDKVTNRQVALKLSSGCGNGTMKIATRCHANHMACTLAANVTGQNQMPTST